MIDQKNDQEIKLCCATFYQSDLVRALLGDVFHPGGLDLTSHLGTAMGLKSTDRVLDIASGRGVSAVHLAKHFQCHITGLDFGFENISAAQELASTQGVSPLAVFHQGEAENLPFDDNSFEAVISECSFCTFPDKTKVAREMARVLGRGGRLGITDVTVNSPLPEDIQSVLSWVTCITGAGTPSSYISEFKAAGFSDFMVEDHGEALLEMLKGIRLKLMAAELAAGLGKFNFGDFDLGEAKRLAQRVVGLIEKGVITYTLFVAEKA